MVGRCSGSASLDLLLLIALVTFQRPWRLLTVSRAGRWRPVGVEGNIALLLMTLVKLLTIAAFIVLAAVLMALVVGCMSYEVVLGASRRLRL